MSYTRGKVYSWCGGSGDNSYMAIWNNAKKVMSWHKECGYRDGVCIPQKLFDEIVAMRWAEMTMQQKNFAVKRAIKNWSGNFGCDPLKKLSTLKLEVKKEK